MPGTRLRVRLYGWILFVLFLSPLSRAQERGSATRKLPVPELLSLLEARHEVRFSFLDEDLEGMQVAPGPLEEQSLQGVLEELRQQTQLEVKALDERYYTVSMRPLVRVCGQVFDNFGEEAIGGATVEVLGSSMGSITDDSGRFTMDGVPRGATIGIRHLGFKPQYLKAEALLRSNPCERITLGVIYQQLSEVVVYKYLTTGLSREADGSISLNTSEFGLLPGLSEPDILQSVQALPGIKSISETVSDLNIRGGTNDQNLILWDGIKMYQSGHFFGLISVFNPYLTETVNIIKNGASAQYGEGLSGILSMHTHDRIARTYYGGAGFNLISGDAYAHLPLSDRLAIQFSARRSVTDVLNTPTYTNFTDRAFQDTQITTAGTQDSERISARDENFYFYDFSGKVLYDLAEGQEFRLSGLFTRNNLFYAETLGVDDSQNRSDLNQLNAGINARLSSQWNSRFSSEILGYYSQYELDSRYLTEASGQSLFQLNQVKETALKSRFRYRFNNLLSWDFGYQFIGTGISNISDVNQPPFISRIKDVVYANALFGEWNYSGPGGRLSARAGIRLNYLSNPEDFDRFLAEPRLNLQYELLPGLRLEALGEFKNQTSLQFVDLEQNFLGIERRRWILADEQSLPVVTSRQGSVGLHFDKGYWLASLEGFYKEVDGITTDTQGFQNEDQFNGEIGSYTVWGIESLLNFKSDSWSSWVSYALNQNDYTFETLVPEVFPNNLDIRHTLTLGTNYTYGGFSLGLGLNYRTGRPFTEPEPGDNAIDTSVFPNQINFRDPNSSRLPDYLRVDASMRYRFSISESVKASAGASVLNLTGRRNILNTYYRLSDANEIEEIESLSLGLTPNISFRIQF